MPDQLLDLFESVSRELDREAELVIPTASAEAVRRQGVSHRRRRILVVVALLVVLALGVAGALVRATLSAAPPQWATSQSGAPTNPVSPTGTATVSSSPRIALVPDSALTAMLPFSVAGTAYRRDLSQPTFVPSSITDSTASSSCGEVLAAVERTGTSATSYVIAAGLPTATGDESSGTPTSRAPPTRSSRTTAP